MKALAAFMFCACISAEKVTSLYKELTLNRAVGRIPSLPNVTPTLLRKY